MPQSRKKVLAISGSTRENSTNHRLIKEISELSKEIFDVQLYKGISSLPHFNPDKNKENVAKEIADFREQLKGSDGVIICTPEYAHGVPGTLKNAIDWTVGTSDFSHKPTLLITASTDGKYGHHALLETLRVIEAENIDELQLLIPFASTKMNHEDKIIDEDLLSEIKKLIADLNKTIEKK
jgi:chromate reductase